MTATPTTASERHATAPVPAAAGSATATFRACFGGVEVWLQAASPVTPLALDDADRAACVPLGAAPIAARVHCTVACDALPGAERRALAVGAPPPNHFSVDIASTPAAPRALRVSGPRVQGSLEAAPGCDFDLRGTLTVARGPRAAGHALRAAAAVAAEHAGALNLHASGSVVDGGVVLFIGPSGAGKSTACDLVTGSDCFAYDDVAVLADSAGAWFAYRIPKGKPCTRPLSPAPVLPLRAVLAVDRSHPGAPRASLAPLDPATALFKVRAAVEVGDRSADAEARRLTTLAALLQGVPVGRLRSVLGRPLDAALRSYIARPTEEHHA